MHWSEYRVYSLKVIRVLFKIYQADFNTVEIILCLDNKVFKDLSVFIGYLLDPRFCAYFFI